MGACAWAARPSASCTAPRRCGRGPARPRRASAGNRRGGPPPTTDSRRALRFAAALASAAHAPLLVLTVLRRSPDPVDAARFAARLAPDRRSERRATRRGELLAPRSRPPHEKINRASRSSRWCWAIPSTRCWARPDGSGCSCSGHARTGRPGSCCRAGPRAERSPARRCPVMLAPCVRPQLLSTATGPRPVKAERSTPPRATSASAASSARRADRRTRAAVRLRRRRVPRRRARPAAAPRGAGGGGAADLPRRARAARHRRRRDRRRARDPGGDGLRRGRGLAPINGLYALLLPADRLRAARLLAAGDRRAGGSLSALVGASVLALAAPGAEAAGSRPRWRCWSPAASCWRGCCDLGWVADYFSRPVLVGYIHGVAIVLVISQLGKLLGLAIDARDPLPQLAEVVRSLGSMSGDRRSRSAAWRSRVLIPAALPRAALPGFAAVVVSGRSSSRAWSTSASPSSARIPSGLPASASRRRRWPTCSRCPRAPPACSCVSFADEVLTARSFAGRHDQHVRVGWSCSRWARPTPRPACTQGFPVGASGSRTAVNDAMGARSQIVRAARGGARRARAAVPHRPDRRPAQGRARRGDRHAPASGWSTPRPWRSL